MTDSIEAILYPHIKRGEELLWTGAPEPGFRWRLVEYILMGMSVGFLGLPLLAYVFGATSGLWGIFFVIGIFLLLFGVFSGWLIRRRSRYALTDQRAFLIFKHPVSGVQVKAYPITRSMDIGKFGKSPASVYFATTERVDVQGYPMRIGFALIKDADHIFELMRALRMKAK